MLVGAPAAIGKFDGVGLAEVDHARRHQLAHQRGSVRRDPVAPGGGAAHGNLTLDFHEVLDRDRDAVERTYGMAGANGLLGGLGGKSGVGGVDRDEGVEPGLQAFDAGQVFIHEVDR